MEEYDEEFEKEFGEWYEDEDRFYRGRDIDYEPDYAQLQAEYEYYHYTLKGRIELIRNIVVSKLYYLTDLFKRRKQDDLPF